MKKYEGPTLAAYTEVADLPATTSASVTFFESRGWAAYCERTSPSEVLYFAPADRHPHITQAWLSDDVDGLIGCETRRPQRTLVLAPQKCYESPFRLPKSTTTETLTTVVQDFRYTAAAVGADAVLLPFADPAPARALAKVVGQDRILIAGGRSIVPVPESFDDYLTTMSRGRRANVRNEMRRFEASGLRTHQLDLADFPTVCAPLVAETQEKYGLPIDIATLTNWFEILRDTTAENLVVFAVAAPSERPVGVSILFRHGDVLTVKMVGFQYSALRAAFEYFQLLIYEPLIYCINAGLRHLDLGFGAYQGKVARGGPIHPAFAVDLSEKPLWSLEHAEKSTRERLAELAPLLGRNFDVGDLLGTENHPWQGSRP